MSITTVCSAGIDFRDKSVVVPDIDSMEEAEIYAEYHKGEEDTYKAVQTVIEMLIYEMKNYDSGTEMHWHLMTRIGYYIHAKNLIKDKSVGASVYFGVETIRREK